MPETFKLNDKQLKKISKWMEKRGESNRGTIGGRYEYIFVPTSLSVVEKVRDTYNGEELDVTEYVKW